MIEMDEVAIGLKEVIAEHPDWLNPTQAMDLDSLCLYWGAVDATDDHGHGCIVGQWAHVKHGVPVADLIVTPCIPASAALYGVIDLSLDAGHLLNEVQRAADSATHDGKPWSTVDVDRCVETVRSGR